MLVRKYTDYFIVKRRFMALYFSPQKMEHCAQRRNKPSFSALLLAGSGYS